jgi:hypothetical protein
MSQELGALQRGEWYFSNIGENYVFGLGYATYLRRTTTHPFELIAKGFAGKNPCVERRQGASSVV